MNDWRKPLSHRCAGAINGPERGIPAPLEEHVERGAFGVPAVWMRDECHVRTSLGSRRVVADRYWG